jgi:energy-coupling factor transporter ATP-binding protein EcfA2
MDYSFGGYTLLAGETGSGKTSLIDAVVSVMAGASSRDAKYNVAQAQAGRTSKKSRRTLASYIVGSNGMGRFLRPGGAHGYACVAWDRDPYDGPYGTPFTAIVGSEAVLERESEAVLNGDIVRVLVRGHVVGLADLMASKDRVLPAAQLLVSLRSRYGTAAVRDFRSGGEYLATLYAYLKGDTAPVSREEADSAMKAFTSAIAYRQPDDIDGLIREEILDEVDNEGLIQRLMETIREVNRLKSEAARMEGNIAQLEAAESDVRTAFEAFMDERMFKALIEIRKADDVREALTAKSTLLDQNQAELDKTVEAISTAQKLQEKLQNDLAEVQAQINRNDVVTTKKKLEAVIDEQERIMEAVVGRIRHATAEFAKVSAQVTAFERLVCAVPDLGNRIAEAEALALRFSQVSLPALEAAVQAVRDRLGKGPLDAMRENCEALRACLTDAWDDAMNAEGGLRTAVLSAYRSADKLYDQARQQKSDIERRLERLKVGEIEYPTAVEGFIAELRTNIPRCDCRVLCDVVDVRDPAWQPALEGYLGLDRFTILYDRSFEAEIVARAKMFRRENPGQRGNISVPQLSLAIDDRPHVDQHSIVGLLKMSGDAEAEGYLKARYGRTVMVRDIAKLKSTRSGVMQDGWSTQGYRYQQRRMAEEDLVLGAETRRRQRDSLLLRLGEVDKEVEALETRRGMLHKVLSLPSPAAISLAADDHKTFDEAAELRHMAVDERDGLDLSGIEKLQAQADEMTEKLGLVGRQIVKLSEDKGGLRRVVEGLESEIASHKSELDELEPLAVAAESAHQALMAQAFVDREEWPKRFAAEIKERRSVTSYERRSSDRSTTAANGVAETNAKLAAYNREANDFQQLRIPLFAYEQRIAANTVLTWMHDIWSQIREQIRSQRDTGLPERRAQCEMAERSFTSSFTTDFCATVLSNVEGRDDTIIALNANLEQINFGGDTYKLISSLKAEYNDYIDLFRKIRGLTDMRKADLDLFNQQDLAPAEHDSLFRIRELLLDERDTDHALSELRRIADYRNYRTYDFERRQGEYAVALSKWGTGSGGESETPVYVIRVAVMASAFKIFSQQKKAHFRSIFMDEVFSTMDESRTRRVLRFLKELGLQIVCAAPTRSMAAVLDEFDARINFSKYKTASGDRSDVNVIDLNVARVRDLYDEHRKAVAADAAAKFDKEEPVLRVVGNDARSATSGS